ncbi:MAG: hypothetical protein KAS13_00565 [Candidatus Omnitrophica bacterium]|nr:hypothetical protein [Candidatus Omnitrophota bacterium]
MIDIVMPDLGEEFEEAIISFWLVETGEHVTEGKDIVEVTTEKATFGVPASCAGVITEILAIEGESVPVGNILARIDEEER